MQPTAPIILNSYNINRKYSQQVCNDIHVNIIAETLAHLSYYQISNTICKISKTIAETISDTSPPSGQSQASPYASSVIFSTLPSIVLYSNQHFIQCCSLFYPVCTLLYPVLHSSLASVYFPLPTIIQYSTQYCTPLYSITYSGISSNQYCNFLPSNVRYSNQYCTIP